MPDYIAPFRRMNADRRARLAQPTTANPSLLDAFQQLGGDRMGNDPRGDSRDHRSFAGLGDYFGDPDVQKNGRALMDMVMGASTTLSGFNMATGGYNGMGPQIPAFGMNDAVADEIAQAAAGGVAPGSGDVMGGQTAGGFSGSGVEGDRGFLFEGGVVDEPFLPGDPPGPDDRIIAAKKGERVLTEGQFKRLSEEAKAEIERLFKEKRPIGKAKK